MSNQLPYDPTNQGSIFGYARRMKGATIEEILSWSDDSEDFDISVYANAARKGGLGNLIEEKFFGYKANNDSEPDFKEAGIELKVSPCEVKKDGSYRAGERLVLTMISYRDPVDENFHDSHLWYKCKLLLLVYYLRNKELQEFNKKYNRLHYYVEFVNLFTPPETDLAIIEQDYKAIVEKVMSGRAHELSEGDTMYLGACTKGATAEKSTVPQEYYNPEVKARKRAFCYKQSYMTHVLNEYLAKNVSTYEPIIKDAAVLKDKTFTDYIQEQINQYVGKTDKELCEMFSREYNNNKAQWSDLAFRMLGIRSNQAEEFEKANIAVKAFRIKSNGTLAEPMSFPTFKYDELIQQDWEDSDLHNYFDETKFLFVVYKQTGSTYTLTGCQFWNMPYTDLQETVKDVWEDTVYKIKYGVNFEITKYGKGNVKVLNDFVSESDNRITFVKPHASLRYYEFTDGTVIGDAPECMRDTLPDGTITPNFSFWLSKNYILSQLRDDLK